MRCKSNRPVKVEWSATGPPWGRYHPWACTSVRETLRTFSRISSNSRSGSAWSTMPAPARSQVREVDRQRFECSPRGGIARSRRSTTVSGQGRRHRGRVHPAGTVGGGPGSQPDGHAVPRSGEGREPPGRGLSSHCRTCALQQPTPQQVATTDSSRPKVEPMASSPRATGRLTHGWQRGTDSWLRMHHWLGVTSCAAGTRADRGGPDIPDPDLRICRARFALFFRMPRNRPDRRPRIGFGSAILPAAKRAGHLL